MDIKFFFIQPTCNFRRLFKGGYCRVFSKDFGHSCLLIFLNLGILSFLYQKVELYHQDILIQQGVLDLKKFLCTISQGHQYSLCFHGK